MDLYFQDLAWFNIAKCEHALELDRNLADAHANIGFGKIFIGRAEETDSADVRSLALRARHGVDIEGRLWVEAV
jgi:hypothetical protein